MVGYACVFSQIKSEELLKEAMPEPLSAMSRNTYHLEISSKEYQQTSKIDNMQTK